MTENTRETLKQESTKTDYADVLNALSEMQSSPLYYLRRDILERAQTLILSLEAKLKERSEALSDALQAGEVAEINNIDSAREFLVQWHRTHFKDAHYSEYIRERLAGDFAIELARSLITGASGAESELMAEQVEQAAALSGFRCMHSCCNVPQKFCSSDVWQGELHAFSRILLRILGLPAPVNAAEAKPEKSGMHSKLPWRITEANERKSREIVGADGSTVAKLTALDMDNAQIIVSAVNATLPAPVDAQTENTDAEMGKWLFDRFVGYDFQWGEPPIVVACFEVGSDFQGGRDIRAAIAANQGGE